MSSSVLLRRATGDDRYAAHAIESGRRLLQCQERRFVEGAPITGYFCQDASRQTPVHCHHTAFEEAPLIALAFLCGEFPKHADWIEWYAAVAIHSEFFLKRGARIASPYGLLPNSVWHEDEILAQKDPARREDMLRQFRDGTPLGGRRVLRTFPIYVDHKFHGSTHIQMSQTWALAEAARLRGDGEAIRLVGRQFEWVLGANPFGQSLMYGEGYDFAPQFAYCLKNLVGSLPVGMDPLHGDAPYWYASCEATFKEIWVEPVNRFLGAMSVFLANPQSVAAKNPDEFPSIAVVSTKANADAGTLHVVLEIRGTGEHTIGFQACNATSAMPATASHHVRLAPSRPMSLCLDFRIADPAKPWVIVFLADGDRRTQREVVGAFVAADGLD